jgi:outer membrane protein insertion porin family
LFVPRIPLLVVATLVLASAGLGLATSEAAATAAPARKQPPTKLLPASRRPLPAPSSTPLPPEPSPSEDVYGPGAPPPGGATPKPRRTAAPSPRDLEKKDFVREVRVVGNMRISEDRILLTTPVGVGDKAGRSDILDAVQRIYGMGFFSDVRPTTEPVLGGIRVVFQVVENPTLRGVRFEGVTKLDLATLEAHFKSLVGDIINFNAVKEGVDKVQKQYADAGYPLARVADMGLGPDGTLLFRIAEGRIHSIKVTGNEETKEHVVLRELSTRPGEIFNGEKMRMDLRRVYNLNFFEDVNLKFEPAPRPEGGGRPSEDIVVVIALKEKQTGSINLGAGYSTRDGILGMFTVKKDNLLGTGRQVGLDLSISQQLRVAGELNYQDPWFDNQRTGLGGALYVRRFNNFLADFREDRMGGSFNVSRPLFGDPLTSQWRGTLGARLERIATFDNVWAGGNAKPAYPNGKPITVDPGGVDGVLGANLGVTFDSRDIIINPTEGVFGQVSIEPALVNDTAHPLLRGTSTGNVFFPMPALPWAPNERSTIAIGTRLGLIAGPRVPAYERFFSTGPFLVRGWPEFVSLDHPTVQKYGINYFQGSNAFVGSLEYRFPIFNIVSGVIFGDTGIFWDDRFDPSLLHSGYGAGVRLTTPLGPIRLDYGLNGLEPGQFHFSIGQKF